MIISHQFTYFAPTGSATGVLVHSKDIDSVLQPGTSAQLLTMPGITGKTPLYSKVRLYDEQDLPLN